MYRTYYLYLPIQNDCPDGWVKITGEGDHADAAECIYFGSLYEQVTKVKYPRSTFSPEFTALIS